MSETNTTAGQHAAGQHAGPHVDERLEQSVGQPGTHEASVDGVAGTNAGVMDTSADTAEAALARS